MSSLSELQHCFTVMESAWKRGELAALLMVAAVRGSSYRRPGAKITITSDGEISGSLSGGCLESDLAEWTKLAIQEQKPRIQSYNLAEDELWGLGIGCKGSLDVLILPIRQDDPFWQKVKRVSEQDQCMTLVLNMSTGEGWLFNDRDELIDQIGTSSPSAPLLARITEVRTQREHATVFHEGDQSYVIDVVRPREKLIVAGAGHDAVPVVELALKADFDVTVLDPRSNFNHEQRFPSAEHMVKEPSDVDPKTVQHAWWVIMNHHMQRDREALQLALNSNPKYVGLLGPLNRTEELFEQLGLQLQDYSVFAPIGLDIGGETIEEVAISIVAELLAVRNGKEVVHLKGKGKIH